MTIRCSSCIKPIVEDTKYIHWLGLMNFLDMLETEDYISTATYESMVDKLMSLKSYAFNEIEDIKVNTDIVLNDIKIEG